MSQTETISIPFPSANTPLLSAAVLETLASRFRAAGLCLFRLAEDNSVIYCDTAAGEFFTQFAQPLIEQHLASDFGRQLQSLPANPPAAALAPLPGLAIAAMPAVERRHRSGTLLLVGRAQDGKQFALACQRLNKDFAELSLLRAQLPTFAPDAMLRQGAHLLSMLRDQLALTERERELTNLSTQLSNTYEELSLVYRISGGMRVNRRPAGFFQQICLDAIEVMGVRGLGVALQHGQDLDATPTLYGSVQLQPVVLQRLSYDLLTWLNLRKAPLIVNDFSKERRVTSLSSSARRLLAVPLQRGDKVLGCLFALDKETGDFDSVDAKLLMSIANESAIYLENAVLFEDAHGLMMGLLHSLTSAVDAKDPYTCGHSERVAMLAKLIAQNAGLDENQVDRIYMAGLLHDVGKIGVPESILQKPGKLTDEEFDQMKKHPAIGAHILADVKQVQDIIPGVLHHHERFDGRGYPSKLAGRDIPPMGRIICLADCFDAMTSTRTYRKAMPLEAALADIRRCSGTQFDPAFAESFLQIEMDQLRQVLQHTDSSRRLDPAQAANPTPALAASAAAPIVRVATEKAA